MNGWDSVKRMVRTVSTREDNPVGHRVWRHLRLLRQSTACVLHALVWCKHSHVRFTREGSREQSRETAKRVREAVSLKGAGSVVNAQCERFQASKTEFKPRDPEVVENKPGTAWSWQEPRTLPRALK
eukprot:3833355-Pleurochrysis_carterae.AAC.1